MIQNIDILKSYFEAGDFPTEAQFADLIDSFVHKEKDGSSTFIGTVFIDVVNGDNASAKIESRANPFKTIDAAITTFNEQNPRENATINHPYLVLKFVNEGVYEWNTLIPERNIIIDTENYSVTIDFSNNLNAHLNETIGNMFNFIIKGEFLTLKNHSENFIAHGNMNFYGFCDVIDTRRNGFGGFSQRFITAREIKIKYNLVKGYGNVFRSYSPSSFNEFIGNIAAEGNMVLNSQGNGYNLIDFDTATSTGKLMLLKVSLPGKRAKILFGECLPTSAGNLTEMSSSGGTVDIVCKHNAKSFGTFQGTLNFSGHSLEALLKIARIGADITFTKMHLILHGGIASIHSPEKKIVLKDCLVEIEQGGLCAIETHTSFTTPILELKGHNTILHKIPGSDLVTKYSTANPIGVSYKQFTAGGLKTNAVLNTTITGNTNTEAILITETTNTY
ncbi:hypothetical protein [uncultured Kordia sp.]|uniref:hypothetical protein n=1 Tax=uncultured Kordia sp. TaxID=507699 RepID=UPI0026326488|nr:hypothetical protein [uncultured Kordia sp.]